jgi:hypothetical protein
MGVGTLNIRSFREGDEAAILRFLDQTSGGARSLDEWAWLFPPEEGGRAIVVGERGSEVEAVCAGTPIRVAVDGREWDAVELRRLASRDLESAGRVLDHFVRTFESTDRFSLIMAPFDFDGAAQARLTTLVRDQPAPGSFRRFPYRAEPARDWEPRLDALWQRVRSFYPVAVVRDANRALRRFAGHPRIRHHRFLVFPRYSSSAVAAAVFADDRGRCRWLDLVWDHAHPGALELLAHISGRLTAQFKAADEEMWLAGDGPACELLSKRGFRPTTSSTPRVAIRCIDPQLDAGEVVDRAYVTAADIGACGA